jgi:arylsulfatase A-like enzyme
MPLATQGRARRAARGRLRSRLALLAAGLGALAACHDPSRTGGSGRGVLVIAIDGLRADHLSSAGYDRETTPTLDEIARAGVSFTQAFSASSRVIPSHAALLTGCAPLLSRRILPESVVPTVHNEWRIPDRLPSLPKEFLRHGYATAAFADDPLFAPLYGFAGGFQTFLKRDVVRGAPTTDFGVEVISAQFEQWLRNQDRDQNWFAYLELSDLTRIWSCTDPVWDTFFKPRPELSAIPPIGEGPQIFFAVPRPKWQLGLHTLGESEAEYDGALRRVDQAIGRLRTHLQNMGAWEQTTVVITGTFGTAFGENGLILDHGLLSDVDLHVPLIVRPAQSMLRAAGESEFLASSIDVAPTLLELLGLERDPSMHGVSLAGVIRGEAPPARSIVFASCGLQAGWAAIDGRWCFERVWPGQVKDFTLLESWYGDAVPHRDDLRETLHDRRGASGVGHLASVPLDPAAADPLRAAGLEWEERTEAQRRRVQAEPGPSSPHPAGQDTAGPGAQR